ncbi:MAG: hypothetical protein AB4426_12280 [Xenococcaceae cyanobacterium]
MAIATLSVDEHQKDVKRLQRKLERSRRANNPDNYELLFRGVSANLKQRLLELTVRFFENRCMLCLDCISVINLATRFSNKRTVS